MFGHALIALIVLAYFAPSIAAYFRSHQQLGAILVVNLFLGVTVVGWIVALAMAAGHVRVEQ